MLLIALLFAVSGVNVLMSYATRDLMTALSKRQNDQFLISLYWYLGAISLAVPVAVFYRFTEERFALRWRQWLTQHLIRKYLSKRAYYKLRSDSSIDNPDQRIAEDVKNFTATSLSFLLITLNSIITLIAFISVLYSISHTLVAVLVLYAIAGTFLTMLVGQRLVKLHFRQYRREATLRYGLVRVRDNAESIAFYRGEPREVVDLYKRFLSAVRNMQLIIGWNRNLGFFTTGYHFISLILPTIIVARLYLRGEVELGVVTQAQEAFAQVLAAVSLIILQFERLSAFIAGVKRLGEFWDSIEASTPNEDEDAAQLEFEEANKLRLKNVSVFTPKRERELIHDLNFNLKPGEGLLIMGESGSGKSSLLRTVAGIWDSGDGTVYRPGLRELVFLPQRPYLIQGSLRSQLLYPKRESLAPESELRDVLKKVNLEGLLKRVSNNLDKELDWSNILSLGEQQRVSFARLLLIKPTMAFLDEATSALDQDNEALLYGKLRELDITFVSVGHRDSLRKYHDKILVIESEGSWKIEPLTKAA